MLPKLEFGARLAYARKLAHLSQDQLGEVFGVTKQTVSHWERERNDPPTKVVRFLCERSGLSADYLLCGAQPNTMKSQLSTLFDQLTPDLQHSLVVQANAYFNLLRPNERSHANPFPGARSFSK